MQTIHLNDVLTGEQIDLELKSIPRIGEIIRFEGNSEFLDYKILNVIHFMCKIQGDLIGIHIEAISI
jgi:hypothetical protein